MIIKVDKCLELHHLVLKGDGLSLSKLIDLLGETIINKLKKWYPKVAQSDTSLIQEAVSEAFLGYFRNPLTFNSTKNTLQRFLEIAAERDLLNILEKEKKHTNTIKAPDDVELEEKFWNSILKEYEQSDTEIIYEELVELVDKELFTHFDCELDVKLAKLVISGERETTVFSSVLKLEHLHIDEQRAEVKRNKDRIKKVLDRNSVEEKLKKIGTK